MLSTQHAVVGSAVSIATGNPIIGFAAALASHHLLDCVPHVDGVLVRNEDGTFSSREVKSWSSTVYLIAYIDVILTLGIIGYVMLKVSNPGLVAVGAIGGIFPDLLDNVSWWNENFRKIGLGKHWHWLHEYFHYHWKRAKAFQVILAVCLQTAITVGGTLWLIGRGI